MTGTGDAALEDNAMNIDLTTDEATLLATQLSFQVDRLQNELVHTDDRRLREGLVRDLEGLSRIRDRVKGMMGN